MKEFSLAAPPPWVKVNGGLAPDCRLLLAPATVAAGAKGKFKLSVQSKGGTRLYKGVQISLANLSGNLSISLGGDHHQIEFGEGCTGHYDLRLWRKSSVRIGRDTTANGVRIICDHSDVEVGEDSMFSDEILLQSADQHPIIDLKTGSVINNQHRRMVLAEHVWVGRGATVMPDVSIGRGAIIGTGALVTRSVPATSVAVGVPAKVVRSDTTWSRQFGKMDAQAQDLLDSYQDQPDT
ncbi:acyltransferase [Ideonella sp.]|uniref:acyltransferase n=1 Tax=Ideonella sp. TaxID=1929293 RepID=UPI003BB4EE8B